MKVGVLGLGSIGLRHARNLLALGAEVIGFDPDPARRALLVEFGGHAVDDREQTIEQAEAIVIASPNAHHRDDLCSAIAAGRHVLVEKPLAHSVEGLDRLIADAAEKDLVVLAGFNLRFHPCVVAAKAHIEAGAIGQLIWVSLISASFLPEWRPYMDYRNGYAADPATGGIIFDAIHEIDLALHLIGPAHVVAASATKSDLLGIFSDAIADFILVHENSARSNFHLDYISRPPVRTTRICGSEGALELDLRARRLVHYAPNGKILENITFAGSFDEDYVTEMTAFLNRIIKCKSPGAVDEQGLRSLEVAIAVRKLAGLPQS